MVQPALDLMILFSTGAAVPQLDIVNFDLAYSSLLGRRKKYNNHLTKEGYKLINVYMMLNARKELNRSVCFPDTATHFEQGLPIKCDI
jgi:hypothetical protein